MPTLQSVQVGETLFVFDHETKEKVAEQIEAELRKGKTRYNPDGSTEWISVSPICDHTKSGSAAYTWDRSGNRVKCERHRCFKTKDGEITKVLLGTTFLTPD